jgi:4-diphosphocytidyl-2-C-methyl-D-erythritol kinase
VSGELRVAAPAKLNLFLHVGDRRADGFHDLESLVAFTSCGDAIRLQPDSGISLSIDGPFGAKLPRGEDNLALRAARMLAENNAEKTGARILLQKNLPVASGLGGGSADAAAVLRGLVRLWNLDITREALRGMDGGKGRTRSCSSVASARGCSAGQSRRASCNHTGICCVRAAARTPHAVP